MPQRITQVDAFTDRPLAGNPAAVCILPSARDASWMQAVAREMNLSETAFLVRRPGAVGFDLRWFTPAVEVDLCGHATLASAHVLWEERHLEPRAQARFHTKSGVLTAERGGDRIELDFPRKGEEPATDLPDLSAALGAPVLETKKNRFDYLALLEDEAAVARLAPDMTALRRLPVRGVIATSRASSAGADFVSRFFAPAAGVDEDPVTGSAHCFLAPFWSARLGRPELVGRQLSARGGTVYTRVEGERVKLGGHAVTVLVGELLV